MPAAPVTLKPRPTTYKGVKMRSRLEATYAAWLDAAGVEWEYEPRAYAGEGGQYLPDFWIPKLNTFIEVKPTLDLAWEWTRKMEVIWESVNDARLIVDVPPQDAYLIAGPRMRDWVTRSKLLNDKDRTSLPADPTEYEAGYASGRVDAINEAREFLLHHVEHGHATLQDAMWALWPSSR